ncbi:ABC-type dipeptide/oligopeptide/nickel transport systems, permease component (plasmid) [Paracoccus aminophilus JCM 7686]|uniref:ABC-type dipeptide/oligopeptide/nickel transport systems, permease component n=1 Tax=Paracoccus aminophilus JCM 7686 TaxID=1367847 RepID=S5Y4X0_PARAH|nr:ABC-type dipeptide/oligopeptide/nickel transport systems, permease component [Paracoccus aminophilus JCM 7686]
MHRRLLTTLSQSIATLVILLIACFFLTRLAYRNPAAMLAPINATQESIDAISRALRLDEPWYLQLWHYLYRGPDVQGAPMGLMHWPPGLGYSFRKQAPVTDLILSKLPATLSLVIGAALIWFALSILSGVWAARHQGKWQDHLSGLFACIFMSVPVLLSGILFSYVFFYLLTQAGWAIFPSSGYVPLSESPLQWARHLALPWATLALVEAGLFQRVVRGAVLDVAQADYIRTARAKGLPEGRIYFSHALSAALNPIISLGALEIGTLLGGAIVTETIFGIDGLGRLAVSSAIEGDFPVVIGTTVTAGAAIVLMTAVGDFWTEWREKGRS